MHDKKCDSMRYDQPFKNQVPCGKVAKYKTYRICMGNIQTGSHKRCGRKRRHREYLDLCKWHYLESTLGIAAFRCTKKCMKEAEKKTQIVLSPEDLYTYVSVEQIYTPSNKAYDNMKGTSMEYGPDFPAFHVKCQFCGRILY